MFNDLDYVLARFAMDDVVDLTCHDAELVC